MLQKISPTIWSKHFPLPLPSLSPKARQIHRMMFRNERKFYHTTCPITKKPIISTIAPERWIRSCESEVFHDLDHTQFARTYSGNIWSDYEQLLYTTPLIARYTLNMENSPYCNQETDDKNCYYNMGWHYNEACLYNTYAISCETCIDNYRVFNSQHIYNSQTVYKSHHCFWSTYIDDSSFVYRSYDIAWSHHMLFCNARRNASYMYQNQQLTKQQREDTLQTYKRKIKTIQGKRSINQEYQTFLATVPQKQLNNIQTEKVIGNDLYRSKNLFLCSSGEDGQDVRHSNLFAWSEDCMDIESSGYGKKVYNSIAFMHAHNCVSTSFILETVKDCYYSSYLSGGTNLFACIGLKNKDYCLLNKSYTKQDREQHVSHIITSMQEQWTRWWFFPTHLSHYPYNDTTAQEYYPVKQVLYPDGSSKLISPLWLATVTLLEAEKFIAKAHINFGWTENIPITRRTQEKEVTVPPDMKTINACDLPPLQNIQENITDLALICTQSKRPFRVVKPELAFYNLHGIQLPEFHPDIRHQQRVNQRPWRELYLRTCDKCGKEILSVYPSITTKTYESENTTQPQVQHAINHDNTKVYCEQCYQKQIYG